MLAQSPNPEKKFCKHQKCQSIIGKEGALARHVLGENRFTLAQSPPFPSPKKKELEGPVRVIVPQIIIIITIGII